MNCKNFRQRRKQGKLYFYCILKKQIITYDNCNGCTNKEYKQYKALKSHTSKLIKREKNRYSIIYNDMTKCCECGSKTNIEKNEIFGSKTNIEKNEIFSGAYRQISIKLGMVAPMCHTCHQRFHNDITLNLKYKVKFQKEYMKTHTLDDFIKTFGKNYIYKLEQQKIANKK